MKNTTTNSNGAAKRTTKMGSIQPQTALKTTRMVPHNGKARFTIEIDSGAWGQLSEGAFIHQMTQEEVVERFLESNALCNWAMDGFPFL